jgi:hypothetical protein
VHAGRTHGERRTCTEHRGTPQVRSLESTTGGETETWVKKIQKKEQLIGEKTRIFAIIL